MFQPSIYQTGIFDWIADGSGHGVVNAVAGSGKSTTLEEGVKNHIPLRNDYLALQRILLAAFNKHIELALKPRMPKHATVATFNAFGWRLCRQYVRGVELMANKDHMILSRICPPEADKMKFGRLRQPVLKMVSLLKALNERTIDNWEEHSKLYGVEMGELKPSDNYVDVLREVWNTSVNMTNIMSFDDQKFMPIYNGWQLPEFDWILVDETQDASPISIELITRMASNGRLLLVGDPDQSIYLFAGAHPDAMATLTQTLGATELPLSVCYRCSDAIIECAQEEVPRMEAPSPNPNGAGIVEEVSTEDFLRRVKDGDMVLCRTTAPLVKRCLQLLNMGRKAFVKGRDLVNQVIMLVEQVHGNPERLQEDVGCFKKTGHIPWNSKSDLDDFIMKLTAHKSEQVERLIAQGNDAAAQTVEDRCEGVLNFACRARFVGEIIVLVESVTSDDMQEGVAFMSGHKSKGLEASKENAVWLLRPDLCPHPRAKSAVQQKQEKNLRYVMKTRGRGELYFVMKERDEK